MRQREKQEMPHDAIDRLYQRHPTYFWIECDKGYFGCSDMNKRLAIEVFYSLLNSLNNDQPIIRTMPRLLDMMAWAEQQGIDYKVTGNQKGAIV